jgi:hypothetical protein
VDLSQGPIIAESSTDWGARAPGGSNDDGESISQMEMEASICRTPATCVPRKRTRSRGPSRSRAGMRRPILVVEHSWLGRGLFRIDYPHCIGARTFKFLYAVRYSRRCGLGAALLVLGDGERSAQIREPRGSGRGLTRGQDAIRRGTGVFRDRNQPFFGSARTLARCRSCRRAPA